jgi:hypothetical protein
MDEDLTMVRTSKTAERGGGNGALPPPERGR